jgi:uncharacterized membrane protein (Fun14 family)
MNIDANLIEGFKWGVGIGALVGMILGYVLCLLMHDRIPDSHPKHYLD